MSDMGGHGLQGYRVKGPEVKCSPRKPIVLAAKRMAPARATNVEAVRTKIENPLRKYEKV